MLLHVTLEQDEDGFVVAECPALPGCVSQGKDEQEALATIKEPSKHALGQGPKTPRRLCRPDQEPRPRLRMSRLGDVSGKQAAAALQRAGWIYRGQVGSHAVLTKDGSPVNPSVPQHKELGVGILRVLI